MPRGEFGHYKVVYDEKAHPCHCGGKGCLTTIASLGGIRKFRGWADHVFQYPEHRPADFDTGMEEMTTAIARMLANTAILFNPDHILLTGKVAEWLREDLQRNVERQLLPLLPEHCREIRLIMPDTVPDYALLAACYVMDRMFGPPSEEMADGSE